MPKLMTEKQLLANRANAKKGGRKPGKLPPEIVATRKVIRMTLQERCRKNEKKTFRS